MNSALPLAWPDTNCTEHPRRRRPGAYRWWSAMTSSKAGKAFEEFCRQCRRGHNNEEHNLPGRKFRKYLFKTGLCHFIITSETFVSRARVGLGFIHSHCWSLCHPATAARSSLPKNPALCVSGRPSRLPWPDAENTVPAMIHALSFFRFVALELDVVISKETNR